MTDKLRFDYISSIPEPLVVRLVGDSWAWAWPVHDIDAETGLFRIDVCRKLEAKQFSDAAEFKDGDGTIHDPETWYTDWEHRNENPMV